MLQLFLNMSLYSRLDTYCTSPNISSWVYTTATIYLSLIGVFGIFTNLAIVVVYLINSKVYTVGRLEICYNKHIIFLMLVFTIIIVLVCKKTIYLNTFDSYIISSIGCWFISSLPSFYFLHLEFQRSLSHQFNTGGKWARAFAI